MSDIFYLWLFTRADTIQSLFQFLMVASGILFAGSIIARLFTFVTYSDGREAKTSADIMLLPIYRAFRNWSYVLVAVFFVSSLMWMVTPGKRDVAIIVGGHLMVEAVKSPVVQATASKLNELIQGELDSALDDLHEKQDAKAKREPRR